MVPFGPVWSGEMDINDTKWVKTTSKMFNLFPNIFISNIHISNNDIKIRKFDFQFKYFKNLESGFMCKRGLILTKKSPREPYVP